MKKEQGSDVILDITWQSYQVANCINMTKAAEWPIASWSPWCIYLVHSGVGHTGQFHLKEGRSYLFGMCIDQHSRADLQFLAVSTFLSLGQKLKPTDELCNMQDGLAESLSRKRSKIYKQPGVYLASASRISQWMTAFFFLLMVSVSDYT